MAKITKREIREGLEEIPIEQILLGSSNNKQLTHKQKTFAKQVALGKTKADAYRIAYDTEGKPVTASANAQKLVGDTRIKLLIDAYTRAFEAREYRKPERLRELVIHQLTEMALDPDVKDAQRIKSLELLGKVSEVGAFTERKETKVIHESSKIKEKLMDQLKNIINIESRTINADDADELLREISGDLEGDNGDPTTTPPPNIDHAEPEIAIHSIPHKQSTNITKTKKTTSEVTDSKEEKSEVETFPPPLSDKKQGEGVHNFRKDWKDEDRKTPPVSDENEKG